MIKDYLVYVLVLLTINLGAQDWSEYSSFYSSGSIPQDFTENYARKYERMRNTISKDQSYKQKKREDDFYRKTEYFLDDFLISGDVIFGDTISQYCERILDLLLADNPDLRKQLRVYTIKSPDFNAFATATGIVLVNVGLLAEVENEAQLAMVLAHEVIHFEENHVIDQYVEQIRIAKGEHVYQRENYDRKLQMMSSYSKQQELEADAHGFNRYFKKSGYSQTEPLHLMEVMQFSDLPFDDIPFEKAFLETEGYKFPDYFFLDEITPIIPEDAYDAFADDSKSSHPNIGTRRNELNQLKSSNTGELFIISEEWFTHCQRLARYETCRLHLLRRNFPEAVYTAFLLSKKYGIDKFQRVVVAKALQGSSVYVNNDKLFDIYSGYKKVSGESQQIHYIWKNFNAGDLNTLAVAYAWELHRDYPEDQDILAIYKHALYDLVFSNELKANSFLQSIPEKIEIPADTPDTIAELLNEEESAGRSGKIMRIKKNIESEAGKNEEQEEEVNDKGFYKSAFLPYFSDSLFNAHFATVESMFKTDNNDSKMDNSSANKGLNRYDKNVALGIDSILLINTRYLRMDERDKDRIKFTRSDKAMENYNGLIQEMANRIGLHVKALDYKNLASDEVSEYNDLCVLNNWIQERIHHQNTGARLTDFNQAERIREEYGIDYVAYTGNFTLRAKETNVGTKLSYGILLFPILPFIIAGLLTPDFDSFNYFFLFDLRTGNAVMAEYNYYSTADRNDFVKSMLYNNLIQIKSMPKK